MGKQFPDSNCLLACQMGLAARAGQAPRHPDTNGLPSIYVLKVKKTHTPAALLIGRQAQHLAGKLWPLGSWGVQRD